MPITFTLDDDGNPTWDRSSKEELTHQEAQIIAAIRTADMLRFISESIDNLADAIESIERHNRMERTAAEIEVASKPKRRPSAKKRKR